MGIVHHHLNAELVRNSGHAAPHRAERRNLSGDFPDWQAQQARHHQQRRKNISRIKGAGKLIPDINCFAGLPEQNFVAISIGAAFD
ncbi:hypothetical protein AGMMS49579_13750 [Spirochaetia bacterium]|nr:hypothetical protein AGMMS49579_13750 [Spirochaetia bacterium]